MKSSTLPAVSYFPFDEQSQFTSAASNLEMDSAKTINWSINSTSDKNMYLRQDVSLLFENGKLKGARSKWKQDTNQIAIKEILPVNESSLFQTISYHHGEIHFPGDEKIKSIQQMSAAELYVADTKKKGLIAFESPATHEETEWKNLLDKTTKQQLLVHWHQLFSYFDIDKKSYLAVPVTQLYKYDNEPLPSLSQAQTDQIVGQLWEGLYKNYIIPATNLKKSQDSNFIPIILFNKKQKYLRVLFQLDGEKQQLIQKYPN
jgi:hypothetical protein